MICMDIQPFSIVEDDGFIRLISNLEPRYKLPDRKYFSSTLIPQFYKDLKTKITESIAKTHLSFTSDVWTCSVNNKSFISLTCTGINQKWKRFKYILGHRHFEGERYLHYLFIYRTLQQTTHLVT